MIKEYIKYLKDNPEGYWFKAKLYGFGWAPAAWQGWLVLFVYIVAITLFSLTVSHRSVVVRRHTPNTQRGATPSTLKILIASRWK